MKLEELRLGSDLASPNCEPPPVFSEARKMGLAGLLASMGASIAWWDTLVYRGQSGLHEMSVDLYNPSSLDCSNHDGVGDETAVWHVAALLPI
jgi:hypothetical protein